MHLYVSEAEQVVIVAEPPAFVPLAALLSQAVSRMLGSPVTLPLDALFSSSRDVLGQLRGVLAPGSTGTSTGQHTGSLQAEGARMLPEQEVHVPGLMWWPRGAAVQH